jgi:hypothetical protein
MTVIAEGARTARGRPKMSDWRKYDFHRDYYVAVETVRHEQDAYAGKVRPAAEACRLLNKRGGLAWIDGGDASALSSPRKGKERRYIVDRKGKKLRFRPAEYGTVHVQRLVQHVETIESRYDEAARIARQNENVKFAWDNMVRTRCGLPSLPRKRWVLGDPPIVIDLGEYLRGFSRVS